MLPTSRDTPNWKCDTENDDQPPTIEDSSFSDRSQFSSTHAAALTKAKSLGFADGDSKPTPTR